MPSDPIRQGDLLARGRLEVRIRREGNRSALTVTNGTGGVRLEQEIEIDADRFDGLWLLTSGARIEKTRRLRELEDDHLAEIDVYAGDLAGLTKGYGAFGPDAAAE